MLLDDSPSRLLLRDVKGRWLGDGTIASRFLPRLEPPPTEHEFAKLIKDLCLEVALTRLRDARKREPSETIVDHRTMTRIGYQALDEGDHQQAVEVFRFLTSAYPESADAFDSLGDAFERSGLFNDALAAFERVLALAPIDRSLADDDRKNLTRRVSDKVRELQARVKGRPPL